VFAIIGPNGAGKSTLLNLMSGLYQPDAGRMIFDGVDLVGLPAHKRVRLSLARTFQKLGLFEQFSEVGNVMAPADIHHELPGWQTTSSQRLTSTTTTLPGSTSSTRPRSGATMPAAARRRSTSSVSSG